MKCTRCSNELPDSARFCGHCGGQQSSNTGWFQDPEGRWEARYFANGQMTNQVLVAGNPYIEPDITVPGVKRSRIEPALSGGERLLHEVYSYWRGTTRTAYFEHDGILAITSYRAIKYQTGKGHRSTTRGEGQLQVHWTLVLNPDYLDLLRRAATAGQRPASDALRNGVQVLSGYRPQPVERDRQHPDLVGSMKVTLLQRQVRDDLGSGWRPDHALDRWVRSASQTGKLTGFGQSRVENKDLVLDLLGSIPTILRIDQLFAAAAASMSAERILG